MSETRRLEVDGAGYEVVELLTSGAGRLLYFLADAGPEQDRRAMSEAPPGSLAEEGLRELLAASTALTVTERRFRDSEGNAWLVQNTGPVWAEGGASEGEGLRFLPIRPGAVPVLAPGGHVDRYGTEELSARLAAALQPPAEGRSVG